MKSKKSQITFFIIIGLVLLIIIGLIYYLLNYIVESKVRSEAEESQNIGTEFQAINDFITTCLNQVTKNGLITLGKQGGILYQNQGGLQFDLDTFPEGGLYVKYNFEQEYNVPYRIKPSYTLVPEYPKPCDADPNCEFLLDTHNLATLGLSKLPFLSGSPTSIEANLESYIKKNLKKDCIKWEE